MMSELAAESIVNEAWSRGLQPPPDQSLWEWSDEHRRLGTDSDQQGRYRSERTPYIRGIAECLSPNHPATDISVMKGSQVGLTTVGINWIGYIVHLMPAPVLICLPSEGVAREWSTQRLAQLFEDTSVLRGKIQDPIKRRSGNTTFSKKFSGGYFLKIAWSSSAKKLRSTPAKWVLSDEVDGFEGDTDGEGDPLYILDRRSTNFQGGKHFKISTPAEAARSRIQREFLNGDQRYYFLPCPACGHYQVIRFANLRPTEPGRPETVRLRCIACEHKIAEHSKTQMLANGLWLATSQNQELVERGFASLRDPRVVAALSLMEHTEKVSFHLSALYSPIGWYSWKEAIAEWEEKKNDPRTLKVFVMTVLGEVWVNRGEAPRWEALYERRRQYSIGKAPAGVLFVTAAIDVQKNRKEVEIVGWGRELRSWSIAYERFDGDPEQLSSWLPVEEYLARPIEHESGAELPIQVVVVDSGNWSQIVYSVVARHPQAYVSPGAIRLGKPGTWIASKGGHSFQRLLEGVSSEDASRKRGGLKVFTLGTGFAKMEFYEWLNGKPREVEGGVQLPAGYCEFPDYQPWYFQGIVAERLVISDKGTRKFVADPAVRNEPLDIRLMARLGAHLFLPPRQAARDGFFDKLERDLQRPVPVAAAKQKAAAAPLPENPAERRLIAPKPKYSGDGWI